MSDADQLDLTGQWDDDGGAVYTLIQKTDQDGTLRVTGTLRGGARAGHPNLTGTLNGTLNGQEFTGSFDNREGNVWSAGPAYFTISSDGKQLDGHAPDTLHWDNNSRPLDIQLHFKRKV